jgi:hypothetical protein
MASNHKLTSVIKGRAIQTIAQEEGKLLVTFKDGSVMTVKTPDKEAPKVQAGTVKAVRQKDTQLSLDLEEGSTLEVTTVEPTASVMVRNKEHIMEYAD